MDAAKGCDLRGKDERDGKRGGVRGIPIRHSLFATPPSFSIKDCALRRPGGYGGVAAPVPIPNTAVKRPSADGTSSQDAGE
jgi:hypothetical protein